MKFNTKTIHGNQQHDPSTGAVIPHLSDLDLCKAVGVHQGYEYSRGANPTRTARNAGEYRKRHARICFRFGLAATDSVMKLLNPGDEIIAMDDCTVDLIGCLPEFTPATD